MDRAQCDRRPDQTAAHRSTRDPAVTPAGAKAGERETVTLDHLSAGRLTLGVGLGSSNPDELLPFGEVVEPRERARLLDRGLSRLDELWAGDFEPPPVQRPRIPIWVAGKWPNRRPTARAAAWDGMFPIELPGPDALAGLAAEIAQQRLPDQGPFDLVVEIDPGDEITPWGDAGATWVLTGFGPQPRRADVHQVIADGPG